VGAGIGAPRLAGDATDQELVRACRTGDELAWSLLVERFSRYVYAIVAQAYRLPEHDAEDVFQEVFARAYEHLGRLRSDEAIRPWIGQLSRRLAVDRLRLRAREQPGFDESLEEAEGNATLEIERLELALGVREAMKALPDNCQDILDRFFARDQSYREISQELRVPMGTIASRISRCLTKLRQLLEEPRHG
jgi:RNA polymerase sigma-70 factor, ECF subfamily